MLTSRHDEILRDALRVYGQADQEQIAIGEIGELLTLFGRRAQGRVQMADWQDEIADCMLCLRQLALMRGIFDIEERMDIKAERLAERVREKEIKTNAIGLPPGVAA